MKTCIRSFTFIKKNYNI